MNKNFRCKDIMKENLSLYQRLDSFPVISVNIEEEKIVNYILKIPRLEI